MDKKVWLIIFYQALCFNFSFASSSPVGNADIWVDSVYDELTDTERIAQLIIERVNDKDLSVSRYDKKIPTAGVIVDGTPENSTTEYLNYKSNITPVPYFQFNDQLTSFPFAESSSLELPKSMTLAAIQNNNTLQNLFQAQAHQLRSAQFNGIVDNSVELHYKHGDLLFDFKPKNVGYINSYKIFRNRAIAFASEHFSIMYNIKMDLFTEDILKYIPEGIYDTENWQQITDANPLIVLDVAVDQLKETRTSKFNRLVVEDLFRKNLKYNGPLIADIESYEGHSDIDEVYLISAGYDVIITSQPSDAFNKLYRAWKQKELKSNDVEEKVKNILRYKYQKGLIRNTNSNSKDVDHSREESEIKHSIYESYSDAISLIRNENNALPVRILDTTNFASLSIGQSHLTTFQSSLEKYAPFVHFVLPANDISAPQLSELIRKLSSFDQVVVGVHGPLNNLLLKFFNLLSDNTQLTSAIFEEIKLDEIGSIAGNCYLAYEDNEMTEALVPQMIFGARPCRGVFPVIESNGNTYGEQTEAIGRLAYGMPHGVDMNGQVLSRIDQIALEAVNEGATPGCQVLVARGGNVVYEKSFGTYSYDNRMPVQNRSVYDVASITKVAATTQAIMFLTDRGVINLEDTMGKHLPELRGSNKGGLVIRDVLAHQAGLKAFLPIWQNTLEFRHTGLDLYSDISNEDDTTYEVGFGMYANPSLKDSIWQWTLKSELRRKNNKGVYDYKYSDLGFYLLKALAERVINQPFDDFLEQNIYDPMGMHSTTFNPLCKHPIFDIVPTEDDKDFRQSIVWGTVHDEIAAMNGGVSGHAGLFSNAVDIAKLGQMHLQKGYYGGVRYFSPQIIDTFTSYQGHDSRRGYGWDKPAKKDDDYNPTSKYASPGTFGHSGFTGTVVWVDPEFDLIYVFLSNRIHPDVMNNKLNELDVRRRIQDTIYESIYNYDQYIN